MKHVIQSIKNYLLAPTVALKVLCEESRGIWPSGSKGLANWRSVLMLPAVALLSRTSSAMCGLARMCVSTTVPLADTTARGTQAWSPKLWPPASTCASNTMKKFEWWMPLITTTATRGSGVGEKFLDEVLFSSN